MAKENICCIRFSESDLASIDQKAKTLNLTRSDFIRLCTSIKIAISSDPNAAVVLDTTSLNKIFRELNHWGVNYNQGIRSLNTIAQRLKKVNLSDSEKASIAQKSKDSYKILEDSKTGLLNVNNQIESLVTQNSIVIPSRLLLKLGGE